MFQMFQPRAGVRGPSGGVALPPRPRDAAMLILTMLGLTRSHPGRRRAADLQKPLGTRRGGAARCGRGPASLCLRLPCIQICSAFLSRPRRCPEHERRHVRHPRRRQAIAARMAAPSVSRNSPPPRHPARPRRRPSTFAVHHSQRFDRAGCCYAATRSFTGVGRSTLRPISTGFQRAAVILTAKHRHLRQPSIALSTSVCRGIPLSSMPLPICRDAGRILIPASWPTSHRWCATLLRRHNAEGPNEPARGRCANGASRPIPASRRTSASTSPTGQRRERLLQHPGQQTTSRAKPITACLTSV